MRSIFSTACGRANKTASRIEADSKFEYFETGRQRRPKTAKGTRLVGWGFRRCDSRTFVRLPQLCTGELHQLGNRRHGNRRRQQSGRCLVAAATRHNSCDAVASHVLIAVNNRCGFSVDRCPFRTAPVVAALNAFVTTGTTTPAHVIIRASRGATCPFSGVMTLDVDAGRRQQGYVVLVFMAASNFARFVGTCAYDNGVSRSTLPANPIQH